MLHGQFVKKEYLQYEISKKLICIIFMIFLEI